VSKLILPVGSRVIQRLCKVEIPTLPYDQEAPLLLEEPLHRVHEIAHENDVTICIADEIIPRQSLCFLEEIVDERCAVLVHGYIRNVTETELLRRICGSISIATQDDLTRRT
jgi:hypothetical protein